jgi:hypothetical protein
MAVTGLVVVAALLAGALGGPAVSTAEPASTWGTHLEAADAALARGDLADATHEWHHGLGAALRGRTWLGLLEAGDAYLRLAEAGALAGSAKPVARSLYLEALVQAKAQRSAAGALRAAAAFDRLGDRGVVAQCLAVAESVARSQRDEPALRDVALTRERLGLPATSAPRRLAARALLDRGWRAIRTRWSDGGR